MQEALCAKGGLQTQPVDLVADVPFALETCSCCMGVGSPVKVSKKALGESNERRKYLSTRLHPIQDDGLFLYNPGHS